MKQYKKCYELKNAAKDKLDGKYIHAISICLFSALIERIVIYLARRMPTPFIGTGLIFPAYVFNAAFSLFFSWMLGVMQLGIALFFLNVACDRPYKLTDLFYGYRNDSSRALTVSGAFTLLNAAYQLPYDYLLTTYQLNQNPAFLYAGIIAGVVGLCIYLPVSAGISLSFYLLLDFPDKSAREVLALSFRIMKGHKRRWLYMVFSFLPMILLCICSVYIGFLWLMPYMRMTYACFFLDVMNPKETA